MAKDQSLNLTLPALLGGCYGGCALVKARGVELATRYERWREEEMESTPQLNVSQDAAAQCLHLDRAWIIIILLLWTSCCEE